MRTFPFMLALVLASWAAPAQAVDLSKIDRTIAKEPAYQTKTPKYCLLVFGPEAKTRVWLVLDGKVLYVDRNGDGDLTGAGKRVENSSKDDKYRYYSAGTIAAADGKTQYQDLRLYWISEEKFAMWVCADLGWKRGGPSPKPLEIGAEPSRRPSPRSELRFADRPQDAPILHLDGPLTLELARDKQVLVRGAGPSSLEVMLGTPGLGRGAFTAFTFWPNDAPATATIAFPNREPAGKPIIVQVPLKPGWLQEGQRF